MSLKFEKFKFEKMLRERGGKFSFKRKEASEFTGEEKTTYIKDADGNEVEFIIDGVYHEQNGYVIVTTGDTSQTRSKKQPMIMCLIDDSSKLLKKDDEVMMSGKMYKINAFTDISNFGIFFNISLEMIDDGL